MGMRSIEVTMIEITRGIRELAWLSLEHLELHRWCVP